MAKRQTSGYGRRGASWEHAEGNLAATLLFAPDEAVARLPQLSFVAALAVSDAIARFALRANLQVKWPNDILLDGAKVAGILLELYGAEPPCPIGVGCGVNIRTAPAIAAYPTTSISKATPVAIRPADLLAEIDATFFALYVQWREKGFAPLRAVWLERAFGLGETICVRTAQGDSVGRFLDLDEEGALLLRTPTGDQRIVAGAVVSSELI